MGRGCTKKDFFFLLLGFFVVLFLVVGMDLENMVFPNPRSPRVEGRAADA